ncbi:hypothetical protein B0H13DRAFT_1889223 [Mycena leptocephala]|nr:hypothetical protein B0H13DRAFT_1889223 [Mycena leptocephala]
MSNSWIVINSHILVNHSRSAALLVFPLTLRRTRYPGTWYPLADETSSNKNDLMDWPCWSYKTQLSGNPPSGTAITESSLFRSATPTSPSFMPVWLIGSDADNETRYLAELLDMTFAMTLTIPATAHLSESQDDFKRCLHSSANSDQRSGRRIIQSPQPEVCGHSGGDPIRVLQRPTSSLPLTYAVMSSKISRIGENFLCSIGFNSFLGGHSFMIEGALLCKDRIHPQLPILYAYTEEYQRQPLEVMYTAVFQLKYRIVTESSSEHNQLYRSRKNLS